MYIVVAVPRKDSMSPARANAAPVWALQLICWISTISMYVVIQTAYKPFYAALLLSDIQQICIQVHVHVHHRETGLVPVHCTCTCIACISFHCKPTCN